ncbi:ISWI chromatin-remodeling complex ATPase ISW1 [Dirofilaria immitis]
MAKNEKVGKAIATAHVKDERDVPDYEFPDSGHVKLNLTLSDVAVLERTDSESDMRSKLSSSPIVMKKQIVQIRFIATVAVLLSLGFICTSAFDFLDICKLFKFNGEYIFSGDPKINAAIPRTPEISPPLSPPNLERNETRSMATTTS